MSNLGELASRLIAVDVADLSSLSLPKHRSVGVINLMTKRRFALHPFVHRVDVTVTSWQARLVGIRSSQRLPIKAVRKKLGITDQTPAPGAPNSYAARPDESS